MSDIPEYRVDGRTGKGTWHTLHEWNVINGYEKPDEIVPFLEIIDGVVVNEGHEGERRTRVGSTAADSEVQGILRAAARGYAIAQSRRGAVQPTPKPRRKFHAWGSGPSSPTMFEPGE